MPAREPHVRVHRADAPEHREGVDLVAAAQERHHLAGAVRRAGGHPDRGLVGEAQRGGGVPGTVVGEVRERRHVRARAASGGGAVQRGTVRRRQVRVVGAGAVERPHLGEHRPGQQLGAAVPAERAGPGLAGRGQLVGADVVGQLVERAMQGGAEVGDAGDQPAGAAGDDRVAHARSTSSAAVGTPCAAASMIDRPQPSASEVLVVSQARCSIVSRTRSGWKPWKVTTAPRPSSSARLWPAGPAPGRRRRCPRATAAPPRPPAPAAPSRTSTRLCGTSRLTTAIVGLGPSRGGADRRGRVEAVGHDVDRAAHPQTAAHALRVDGETATTGRPR